MRTSSLALVVLASPALAQFQKGDLVLNFWAGPVDLVHALPDGTVIQAWATADSVGRTEGAGVALDGRALTGRRLNAGISLFDHLGAEEVLVLPQLSNPGDLAVFPNGEIAVVNQVGWIEVFDPDGTFLRHIGIAELQHPWGVHVDSDGTIWVSDIDPGNPIRNYAQDGTLLNSVPVSFRCGDLVRAPNGNLWTIDDSTGRVRSLALDGTELIGFPTAILDNGSGLAQDLDGTLLVSSWGEPRVYRYGIDGTLLETIEFPNAAPGGVLFLDVYQGELKDIGSPYCGPANLNSTGAPAFLSAQGSEEVAFNQVVLHAAQMPANQFGYFLNSMTQGFIASPPGSQGNLCLGGAIGRYSADVAGTGAGGELMLVLDLQNTPTPGGPVAIQPGETWNFQCWFRDKNPGPTSNFTDGVSIQFL